MTQWFVYVQKMESGFGNIYGQCRCCRREGYHREMSSSVVRRIGTRETFIEMFLDCFNLFLSVNTKLSNLICSSCVKKLQEAMDFKALVMESEKNMFNAVGDTLFVNVPEADLTEELDIKPDVKVEPEDDGSYDAEDFPAEDTHDRNVDSSPQPPSPVSAREAALLRRPGPAPLPLPRHSDLHHLYPAFARALDLLRGKVIYASEIENFIESMEPTPKLTRPKSTSTPQSEKDALIHNAALLIENSNATPFRSRNRAGFPCFYCRKPYFETLKDIREHQAKVHKENNLKKLLGTYGVENFVVYIDVTDLKCKICDENIPNLIELKAHLIKKHKNLYYTKLTDRVIPFKLLESNVFECQICGFNFETFGAVERHMNVHYRNYVCKDCGTGFVTKYRLKVHVKSMHVDGSYPCETCKKVFQTQQKLKNHVDTVHKMVKRFKCPKCPERFNEYFRRQKHMVTTHGVAPLQYKCNVCDKSFDRRYNLSRHMKRDHLEERDFQCELCAYKCITNNELRVHMIKHNGERIFECSVCKKSYARKKTLREHMRIHNNDRRFSCAVCGQAFVQKCSLKGHMKTHHVEYRMNL